MIKMELTFPFKNMVIHDLLRFLEPNMIVDFIATTENDGNAAQHFNTYTGILDSALPSFENELIQVIETTDQKTIDTYFERLSEEISILKQRFSLENVRSIIIKFNELSLARFDKEVGEKSNEYFKSENRKLEHLEEYEGYDSRSYLWGGRATPKKLTNYNFYCVEKSPNYIDTSRIDEIHQFLTGLLNKFLLISSKYGREWQAGKIKSKHAQFIKPILFVEGELDINYIKKAASLLNRTSLLDRFDIRQRGGYHNLDKLWNMYKADNWETVHQKKIFLYDCDTEKLNENNGYNYKRIIPTVPGNPIKKGIENLFDEKVIEEAQQHKAALVDVITSSGTIRGNIFTTIEYNIDKQEKKNFCDWVCENGDAETFKNFEMLFALIEEVILE